MTRPDAAALLQALEADLARAQSPEELELARVLHTGKRSAIKQALASLRSLSPDDRKVVAAQLNQTARDMEQALAQAKARIDQLQLEERIASEWLDLTAPGLATPRGGRHPVSVVEARALEVLRRLGFDAVDGPEVETAWHNFDALNIPEHHPARDMQDTFWVQGGFLLRSHTTTVQARVLEQAREARAAGNAVLPIRVASLGRVYRNEAVDATHLAMFHQFEGIWIDRGLTFADLKGTLAFIARALFGRHHRVRFKPKYYPYTEPSVGVDISCGACHTQGCEACHGAGWVTILGAGMVHPRVLQTFDFDPSKVSGIAFGLGTTRMAAQAAGISRVRSLYEPDVRTLAALYGRQ